MGQELPRDDHPRRHRAAETEGASWSALQEGTQLTQQTVKAFNQQFQQRMLDNWEAEKARVLQDELGVADDEIARLAGVSRSGGSGLGRSLGASSSARRVCPRQRNEAVLI